jgi:hypothetical protein
MMHCGSIWTLTYPSTILYSISKEFNPQLSLMFMMTGNPMSEF